MQLEKIRSLIFTGPMIAVATVLMASLSVLASVTDSSGHLQHRIARKWARMVLAISGVRVKIEGIEKIAPEGSYLFIANHQSYMDVPVVLGAIAAPFRFLANWYLFKIPFLGHHLKRAGHLPVNNSNPRDAIRMMSNAAQMIREREVSVLVFPEGERQRHGLGEFREGAALIAIKAGVPVVPLALQGVGKILPRGGTVMRGGDVTIRIGEPIPTVHLTLADRQKLTAQMRNSLKELLGHVDETPTPQVVTRQRALSVGAN